MKKVLLILLAVLIGGSGATLSAQGKYGADSANCIKYLSYYKEYYKQKNYDDALPNWRKAYSICPPTANQNMLIDGTTLIRRLISKNAKNAIYKEALVDSLLKIHDLRAEYYPKYAVTALNNKGLDLVNYVKDDDKALFEGISDIVGRNGLQTKPSLYIFQLQSAVELYKAGTLDEEKIIDVYEKAIANLENTPCKTDKEKEDLVNVTETVENIFIQSKVASVESLVALFTPRLEASMDDLALSKTIVNMLSKTEGGVDTDLFLQAVNNMHRLEPSYQSTYCYKNGLSSKAFASAKKAAEMDETLAGKSYMLIGTIWGSQVCKGNEIESRAPYWVAVDYMIKAKNADASLAEEANSMIAQYAKYYPQKSEAFMYNVLDGQSYTVNCGGMTAVTTVRTQN